MKKQLFASVACFALLVVMFLGSTIAWFTDTQSNVNTMVAGKIEIQQTEVFDTTTVLLPAVQVTKDVTVKNTGNQACYIRTLFAFEDSEDGYMLQMLQTAGAPIIIPGVTAGYEEQEKVRFTVTHNGEETLFTVGYYVHDSALDVGGEIHPLTSVAVSESAQNAWTEAVGTRYELIVLSQASQIAGLGDDPATALNTAFHPITGEHCVTWFGYVLAHTEGYEDAVVAPVDP